MRTQTEADQGQLVDLGSKFIAHTYEGCLDIYSCELKDDMTENAFAQWRMQSAPIDCSCSCRYHLMTCNQVDFRLRIEANGIVQRTERPSLTRFGSTKLCNIHLERSEFAGHKLRSNHCSLPSASDYDRRRSNNCVPFRDLSPPWSDKLQGVSPGAALETTML